MNPKCWRLEGPISRLQLPRLSLAFAADRPAEGLLSIALDDRPWPGGRLFGIAGAIQSSASSSLTDWHARGDDDVIAVYETGVPDAARIDLLWHASRPILADPWLARIDLLLSVRTDRLDWRHDIRLESFLPGVTVVEKFACMSVFEAQEWSLAVMVHPADLARQELTTGADAAAACHLLYRLFRTESLEKGVILRARARAWFLPRGVEPAAVAALYTEFTAADPPLT